VKSRKTTKLKLNRETLRVLEDASLQQAGGWGSGGNASVPVCTRVVSDCISCTKKLDGCPEVPPGGGSNA
jgi:hypothetical protein